MGAKRRLILAGTPAFARVIFERIIRSQDYLIIAIYTAPDRRSGRGRKLQFSPVKQLALEYQIPIFQPDSLKSEAVQQQIKQLVPDLMIVVAYGYILPPAILEAPSFECINVHASMLPRWRGAAPIHRAIEAGDKNTGITIMQMDAGLDTGPILLQAPLPIDSKDNSGSLNEKLAELGGELLFDALKKLFNGHLERREQDAEQATYAPKVTPSEALIDWNQRATQLELKVRAMYPSPGAYTFIAGSRVKLGDAQAEADSSSDLAPGTIVATDESIRVQCQRGQLRINQLQLAGKTMVNAQAAVQGYRSLFAVGHRFDTSS